MDRDLVLAGGVIVIGALAGQALGMLPSPTGGGDAHPISLGLAPSKKTMEEATPTVINLPNENVVFPEVELPPVVIPQFTRKIPAISTLSSHKKSTVRESPLMRSIRRTGRIPTVNVTAPSLTKHVSGKKTAPAPAGFTGKTTTLVSAPSSPTPAPTKVTKAPSTPRSYQSPYISAPKTKKTESKPTGGIISGISRAISSFISGFKTGLFGR